MQVLQIPNYFNHNIFTRALKSITISMCVLRSIHKTSFFESLWSHSMRLCHTSETLLLKTANKLHAQRNKSNASKPRVLAKRRNKDSSTPPCRPKVHVITIPLGFSADANRCLFLHYLHITCHR